MFSPRDALSLALDVAREGMELGEMPIGAVVFDDDRVLGRAYTQERALGRRVVHADLQALLQADEALGFTRASGELKLAVNLEPCLMCMGAAITLGVSRVWFALESPNDGARELVQLWAPPEELPFFRKPREVLGGIRRDESRNLFAEYATGTGPAGMRDWARSLT
ncbi:nucleoside deaminase [Rhodococcus erythropolis]|uniref:nucleoside deaminase n=1 Tax=Rhodococcus erythropolis TaxID=1833 RepID=UPI002093B24F|nr:deaminase [Rhodococcus erythropolis]